MDSEFQVNTFTLCTQWSSSVAVDADGDFVVVRDDPDGTFSDTDEGSVQGQRYSVQAPRLPSVTPPGLIGLAVLLFGIAAAGLRGRFRPRA